MLYTNNITEILINEFSGQVECETMNKGLFFYFLDSCLITILWNSGERIFMEFSEYVTYDTRHD